MEMLKALALLYCTTLKFDREGPGGRDFSYPEAYLDLEKPTVLRTYIKKSYYGTLKRQVLWSPGKP